MARPAVASAVGRLHTGLRRCIGARWPLREFAARWPLRELAARRARVAEAVFERAAEGPVGPIVGIGSAVLTILIGVAAALAAPTPGPPLLMSAGAAAGIGLGLVAARSPVSVLATLAILAILTAFAAAIFEVAPTVVWLYAVVVPAIGLARGWAEGALAGLLAAPALHWIETGVPFDPLDPQTPYSILILIALGAVPGWLLDVVRARRAALDAELARNAVLLRETERAHAAEREARYDAIFMLACAAEARDSTTGVHVRAIRDLAADLAAAAGLDRPQVEEIAWSAMLHDIGKLRVPDRVLLKPGQLSEEEWAIIRQHPAWGEELLRGFDGFTLARTIARWHHENWDGSGYPDGLAGARIPLAARIVRVVDVFDALRSERPYKPAWPLERIEAELRSMRARALDPDLTDLFLSRLPH